MYSTSQFLLFLVAASAIILVPGPDILYVLSRGIANGRQVGIVSGLGIGCGEVIHTILAALGLAALVQASLPAFLVIKYAGAVYLLYLGIKTLRDHSVVSLAPNPMKYTYSSVFWQGVLTNLLNPKAILFFAAFLPQFIDPRHDTAAVQIIVLGTVYVLLDILFLCLLAYGSGFVHQWLTYRPKNVPRVRWITGSILIGLGVRLVFTERS